MKWAALFAALCCLADTVHADEPVRLVFVGDVMLADGPGRTIAAGGDPLAGFDATLRGADAAIGNLECPLSARGVEMERKITTFRAAPDAVRVLAGRFAAMSVANNHSGDWGREAFVDTLGHLRDTGIRPFGGGMNLSDAHAPLWLERKGLRIAVLGYNEYKPRSFEAGPHWPGIAWSSDAEVLADIAAARRAGADVVIPFMHWGWENERAPSQRQQELARRMIDGGADAVVGSHPHVTQGVAAWRGKPIVWSLGNFVFDGFKPGPGREGWLLHLNLDRQGVRDWHVRTADIDADGTPRPSARPAPCGGRDRPIRMECAVPPQQPRAAEGDPPKAGALSNGLRPLRAHGPWTGHCLSAMAGPRAGCVVANRTLDLAFAVPPPL